MSLISNCFIFVLVVLIQIEMSVYRHGKIFESLARTSKIRRNFCCPPGTFSNIIFETQVDITISAGSDFHLHRCYWFLRPVSKADGVYLSQLHKKLSRFKKTFCSEEFRELHPQVMEKNSNGYCHYDQDIGTCTIHIYPTIKSHLFLFPSHILLPKRTLS